MKRLGLIILLFASIHALAQTEPEGYKRAVNRFQEFYNRKQPDSIFHMFSVEVRTQLPLEKNRQMVAGLQTQLGNLLQTSFISIENGVAVYKATFDKSVLAMKITLNGNNQLSGLLFDNLPAKSDLGPGESKYTFKGLSSTIAGTLMMPQNTAGKVPVVLIIAGSGPTDRNGNSPQLGLNTNAYKELAEALAKSGIASLRYDKRLVGESVSPTKEAQLRIDNYIDDAVGLIGQLHDDGRFSRIIVLGHSEGSLIGMVAAQGQPVSGFISVAGAGRPAYEVLTEQMKSQPEYISKPFKAILDSLRKGKTQDNVDASLYVLARPSVQPYLMSWMRFNPQQEIKKLKIPVLIIQGTTDLQVTIGDAEKLKKAKSDAVLDIIPNMNHVLKDAPVDGDKNLGTYKDPNLPLKSEFVTAVTEFIQKLK